MHSNFATASDFLNSDTLICSIKEPHDKSDPEAIRYYNRNLVQAKLKDELYLKLDEYCAKEKLNTSSFLKSAIAYYLEHHG